MTRAEFKERLARLQEVITRGLTYYAVWKKLRLYDAAVASWSLEEQNELLGWWRGFFTPVGFALLDMTLMEFAKVFDRDSRTASLAVLVNAAAGDPNLTANATSADVSKIAGQLKKGNAMVQILRQKRNQELAHVDANPAPVDPLLTQDFDRVVDIVTSAFNRLSTAHDGNVVSWDQMIRRSERDATDVLRILREEMGRKQQEYEKEMVRIGLHEVGRMEKTMGRPLDDEELQSVKKQYGLTEEQMQRIEKEYGSS